MAFDLPEKKQSQQAPQQPTGHPSEPTDPLLERVRELARATITKIQQVDRAEWQEREWFLPKLQEVVEDKNATIAGIITVFNQYDDVFKFNHDFLNTALNLLFPEQENKTVPKGQSHDLSSRRDKLLADIKNIHKKYSLHVESVAMGDLISLCALIPVPPGILYLKDLEECSPEKLTQLLAALSNTRVTHVSLRDNRLSRLTAASLANAFKKLSASQARILNLSETNLFLFNQAELIQIVTALQGTPITQLILKHNLLSPSDLTAVLPMLKGTSVTNLNLSHNSLYYLQIAEALQALRGTPVALLDLSNNLLGCLNQHTTHQFAQILSKLQGTAVTRLVLANNKLNEMEVDKLVRFLAGLEGTPVALVDLSGNNLHTLPIEGLVQVFKGFSTNTNLTQLNLSGNELAELKTNLPIALKALSPHIKYVNLSHNNLDTLTETELLAVLLALPATVSYVNLSGNFYYEHADRVARVIRASGKNVILDESLCGREVRNQLRVIPAVISLADPEKYKNQPDEKSAFVKTFVQNSIFDKKVWGEVLINLISEAHTAPRTLGPRCLLIGQDDPPLSALVGEALPPQPLKPAPKKELKKDETEEADDVEPKSLSQTQPESKHAHQPTTKKHFFIWHRVEFYFSPVSPDDRKELEKGHGQHNLGSEGTFDFTAIFSTIEVLKQFGLGPEQVYPFRINTLESLPQVLRELPIDPAHFPRFLPFVIPAHNKQHALAAVIDTVTHTVRVIDSEMNGGGAQTIDKDTMQALEKALSETGHLASGFKIVIPPPTFPRQQTDDETCPIWTAANLVGVILGLEWGNFEALKNELENSYGLDVEALSKEALALIEQIFITPDWQPSEKRVPVEKLRDMILRVNPKLVADEMALLAEQQVLRVMKETAPPKAPPDSVRFRPDGVRVDVTFSPESRDDAKHLPGINNS